MSQGETAKSEEDAGVKPQRKIKPPSASFLSSRPSGELDLESVTSEPANAAEPSEPSVAPATFELEGPASPSAPDIIFEGPAPTASALRVPEPVAALPETPVHPAYVAPEPVAAGQSPVADKPTGGDDTGVQAAYSKERLLAELRELSGVISGVDSLKFLMPRINRSIEEGAEALTLVSFYRIASRTLLEEVQQAKTGSDQIRRELEVARSRLNKRELELAAAEAANPGSTGGGGPASKDVQDKFQAMQIELAQVNEQREKLLVDFRNMRDRAVKDLELRVFKDKEKFFRNFLPVMDSFERAQQTMKSSSDASVIQEGMNLIANQLSEALRQEGLEPVDVSGLFDPRFHEAVGEVPTQEKEDEHVFDVLSSGYMLGERLIRPAMIRVARNPSGIVIPPKVEGVTESSAPETGEE